MKHKANMKSACDPTQSDGVFKKKKTQHTRKTNTDPSKRQRNVRGVRHRYPSRRASSAKLRPSRHRTGPVLAQRPPPRHHNIAHTHMAACRCCRPSMGCRVLDGRGGVCFVVVIAVQEALTGVWDVGECCCCGLEF